MIGYKMFRVSKKHPGKLYPLFVLADQETKIGPWLPAQCGERTPDGKVKSRLGPLAFRPGWHLADLPLATHIGVMEDGKIKYQRPDLVWCLCEYSDRISYQEEANRNGMNDKGVLVPKKAYLQHIPVDGYYRYKTSPLMFRNWVIAGSIRILRVLPDQEVDLILMEEGLSPMPRQGGPIDLAAYGFSQDKVDNTGR